MIFPPLWEWAQMNYYPELVVSKLASSYFYTKHTHNIILLGVFGHWQLVSMLKSALVSVECTKFVTSEYTGSSVSVCFTAFKWVFRPNPNGHTLQTYFFFPFFEAGQSPWLPSLFQLPSLSLLPFTFLTLPHLPTLTHPLTLPPPPHPRLPLSWLL